MGTPPPQPITALPGIPTPKRRSGPKSFRSCTLHTFRGRGTSHPRPKIRQLQKRTLRRHGQLPIGLTRSLHLHPLRIVLKRLPTHLSLFPARILQHVIQRMSLQRPIVHRHPVRDARNAMPRKQRHRMVAKPSQQCVHLAFARVIHPQLEDRAAATLGHTVPSQQPSEQRARSSSLQQCPSLHPPILSTVDAAPLSHPGTPFSTSSFLPWPKPQPEVP